MIKSTLILYKSISEEIEHDHLYWNKDNHTTLSFFSYKRSAAMDDNSLRSLFFSITCPCIAEPFKRSTA